MQSIRDWMEANPDQAKDVRRANKSYVFFRVTDLATEDEAVGAQGVPLMPGRSIAVDHSLHTYGMPFFITADLPIAAERTVTKFERLVVAQDTGSAIVGPARADIYFGAGDEAARAAGRIKNPGDFYISVAAHARSGRSWTRYAVAARTAKRLRLCHQHDGRPDRAGSGERAGRAAAGTETRRRIDHFCGAESETYESREAAAKAMSRRRELSGEEEALWSGVARSVKPLRPVKTKTKSIKAKAVIASSPAAAVTKTTSQRSPTPRQPATRPRNSSRRCRTRQARKKAGGARPRSHRCADRSSRQNAK